MSQGWPVQMGQVIYKEKKEMRVVDPEISQLMIYSNKESCDLGVHCKLWASENPI